MRLLLFAAATVLVSPVVAHADDDLAAPDPWAAPAVAGEAEAAAPTVDDAAIAPPSAAPVVAPEAAPAPTDGHRGCRGWGHGWSHGTWKHAGWSWRTHEPRIAIGFAKGHLELRDSDDKVTQKSLIGRVVLHRGFELELELSRIDIDGDTTDTHGVALVKTFGRHHLRPYIVGGLGAGSIDRGDAGERDLRYAEFGGGLMLKGRHLAIGVDLRRGIRKLEGDDAMPDVATTDPAARMASPSDADKQHYTRGRILALVYF